MTCRYCLCFVVTLTLMLGFAGCNTAEKTSDKDLNNITYEQAMPMLQKGGTVLVDARQPEHYQAGHLPGAINLPLRDMRGGDDRLLESDRIIVYGESWSDPLSTAGAKRLLYLGYTNVSVFKGGVDDWVVNGRSLVRSTNVGVRQDTQR